MILFFLFFAVLLPRYSNGAHDNFKGVATLWGSGTLNYNAALALATVATFACSVCSYFLAATLIKNFSGKGLIPYEIIHAVNFVLSVTLAAGATVLLAIKFKFITGILVIAASKFGLPVSTAPVSVGSIYGIGLVNKTADNKEISKIVLSWVLTLPAAG